MEDGIDLDVLAFKALADPIRLKIVRFLLDPGEGCCSVPGQVCACDLTDAVGLSQPAVSHHMRILTDAGLVTASKSGRWVFYRASSERFAALARSLDAVSVAARPACCAA